MIYLNNYKLLITNKISLAETAFSVLISAQWEILDMVTVSGATLSAILFKMRNRALLILAGSSQVIHSLTWIIWQLKLFIINKLGTSYRVHFTTSLGPDTTIRIREIDAAF
jgi:hypothetical protein